MSNKRDWSVKNVKTFRGREGHGFNASLYFMNKRVALVYDDASGGPVVFEWKDRDAEKAMQALCGGQSPVRGVTIDPDLLVGTLIDEYESDRVLRRHCKTKVMFRLPTDPADEYRIFKTGFTAEIVDRIHRDYGAKAIIVNFMFGAPK